MAALRCIDALGLLSAAAWSALAVESNANRAVSIGFLLTILAVAWCALLAAWRLARTIPTSKLLPRLWMGALLFRAAGMLGQPVLEDDHYRFLWDGYRFAESGNPYDSPPAGYFDDESVPERFQRVLDHVNNPQMATIYGPVCEWAFRLAYSIAPAEIAPWKLLVTGADLLTLALLLTVATPANALLYAWCPLLIQETAFNSHPDSLGVLALVAALVCLRRKWVGRAAAALGVAAGVKITGVLLAPLLLWRAGWRAWIALPVTAAALWGPFWVKGSTGEFAALAAMARSWEFNSSLFALAGWAGGESGARLLCGAAMIAGYAWFLRLRQTGGQWPRGDWLYGGFFLLSPVVNPWYLLWMLPFTALRPAAWSLAALALVSTSYLCGLHAGAAALGPYEHPAWLRPLEYGGIALAGLAGGRGDWE